MGSILLRFNKTETDLFSPLQMSNITSYYHTYNGGLNNNIVFIPFDLYTPSPSGTINFSILDKFEFIYPAGLFSGYLYAVRYNLLKFKNGAASLQYI